MNFYTYLGIFLFLATTLINRFWKRIPDRIYIPLAVGEILLFVIGFVIV